MFSIIHSNKQNFRLIAASLFFLIYVLAIWTNNTFCNILIFFIGMSFLLNLYGSQFVSIINNEPLDLKMTTYSTPRKFLTALSIILVANISWIPTLAIVDFSSKICLIYSQTPKELISNTSCILLISIPLAVNLITFYAFKDSIILYSNYFKTASTLILLSLPVTFLIGTYWPLDIIYLLKDTHTWGLSITAPLFRFLIEIHTMVGEENNALS